MRTKNFLAFLLSFISFAAFSQVALPHSINSPEAPNDSDGIRAASTYIDTSGLFMSSGFQWGNTVLDFTLYDTLGLPTTLSSTLNQGKPVLLISVALSCPSSRHSMVHVLPSIVSQYGSAINILLVYVLEPHPVAPDPSPYSGTIWTTSINYADSILIRQETNYSQRKNNAKAFINKYNLHEKVLIDDVANDYWSTFGPAPNNAYLITTAGVVYQKYGWFDQSKLAIMNDIALLLMQTTGIAGTTNESSAKIFPNPSNGNATLVVENESSYNFTIVDMNGQILAEERNVFEKVYDLDKFHFAAGTYSVFVQTHSGKLYSLHYIRR